MSTRAPLLTHARYEPGEVLGRGAQGAVLRVRDREAKDRPLVAKISNAGGAPWLLGEFARLARLRLPGVVAAHDLARDERTSLPFLVEDFVDGPDASLYAQGTHTEAARAARLVEVLAGGARALAALHDAGFVHGDLKPAHVRMNDGRATLLDLGCAVARRGEGGRIGYTKGFAAPEVLGGAPPTPRSDLFSLGATARAVAGPEAEVARWLPARVRELLDRLCAQHPADRPESARDVLEALRADTAPLASSLYHSPLIGRDREASRLLASDASVTYVAGPTGIGKTALVREIATRALLSGDDARILDRDAPKEQLAGLVAFLRGRDDAWPFTVTPSIERPVWLVVDDPAAASDDLAEAIEAFRCRAPREKRLRLVVTMREPPARAAANAVVVLEPLDARGMNDLARSVGLQSDDERGRLVRAAAGNPGWFFAEWGSVPLAESSAIARAEKLSKEARDRLADLALVGGNAPATLLVHDQAGAAAIDELFREGLATRRGAELALAVPHLATPLARALGSFDRCDALARRVLEATDAPAHVLFALGAADPPPTDRARLFAKCAERARHDAIPSAETEALLHLLADPRERTAARVVRLERLTRDAGRKAAHAEVVRWLTELEAREPSVVPLALRRRAEARGRAGAYDEALEIAARAAEAARAAGDRAAEAFAYSTRGAVHLYRADWRKASEAFARARSLLGALTSLDDPEEVARLDHNLGVVALYQDDLPRAVDALSRSLATKRALGDSAGVRSCLLNLGIALTRSRRFAEAHTALEEAEALARSLDQAAGLGWSLAARADLALREGALSDVLALATEAEGLGDALPLAVRADLTLLRGEVAVTEGRGDDALTVLAGLSSELRRGDAMIDARALVLESLAHGRRVPADRRKGARAAARAWRRAKDAELREIEAEAKNAYSTHRRGAEMRQSPRPAVEGSSDAVFPLLDALATSVDARAASQVLLGHAISVSGAERAFFVARGAASLIEARDVDGLPLTDPEARLPRAEVDASLVHGQGSYDPSVPFSGGHGSRLVVVGSDQAALVLEHRFMARRFDAIDHDTLGRLSTLVRLVARIAASVNVAPTASPTARARDASSIPPSTPVEISTFTPHDSTRRFPGILGESRALRRALARLDAAIDSELPALITGETGSGKELFAAAIHEHGPRAHAPYVAINCAALTPSLFEAELFGHTRGAFTGASSARRGLLARAEGGTLFLDEVGELAPAQQAALLRVLETRRYRPVGSDDERPFDVRIVAATNRDLAGAVARGEYRQDLVYRLRVLEIAVPPLRDRAEDVPLLARHFLEAAGSRAEITPRALDALTSYAWPGNVRELAHQMQRLAAMRVGRVEAEHLGRELRGAALFKATHKRDPNDERADVERALDTTAGNISRAATLLGLTRHGLKKRMLRLGLRARIGGGS